MTVVDRWREFRTSYVEAEFDPTGVVEWGDAAVAEIERLREENKTFRAAQKACEHCDAPTVAEVERLRELLRYGLEHHDEYNWQKRVREALGE